jgi:hypothetical protein
MVRGKSFHEKLRRRIIGILSRRLFGTPLEHVFYPSYLRYRIRAFLGLDSQHSPLTQGKHYLTQIPDYGAGLGHQLANWNCGYYFAKFFGLDYAHAPLSRDDYETYWGLGEGETTYTQLLESGSFIKVQLPRFTLHKDEHLAIIRGIINSYRKQNVVFCLSLVQDLKAQSQTYKDLRRKFFAASARARPLAKVPQTNFNIAIHIRQKDKTGIASNWHMRLLPNTYYAAILQEILNALPSATTCRVLLISQGSKEDFPEFHRFPNVEYCLQTSELECLDLMIGSDVLIASRSSFSYKPALVSEGIKFCPRSFWHDFPDSGDYILVDNDGTFAREHLEIVKKRFAARGLT